MISIERHSFMASMRITSVAGAPTPDCSAPSLIPVHDVRAFFRQQNLKYYEEQKNLLPTHVMEALSRSNGELLGKRDRVLLDGKSVRGKCVLMKIANYDAAVFCLNQIKSGELIGLYASELVLSSSLSDVGNDRSSMWIVDLNLSSRWKTPPMAFSTLHGGNMFRFLRHCRVNDQVRVPNVALTTVWCDGLPYLVVQAITDIPSCSELVFDWGKEFIEDLDLYDLHMAAGASHALHNYLCALNRTCLENGRPLPPWDRRLPWRLEVLLEQDGARFVCANGVKLSLRRVPHSNDMPICDLNHFSKKLSQKGHLIESQLWENGFAPVNLGEVLKQKGVEYRKQQVLTPRARALIEDIALNHPKKLPPRWEHVFPLYQHSRIRDLMYTSKLTGVEVRRIDALSHHVRWLSVPTTTHYGLVATEDMPKGYPIVVYKGRMCRGDETGMQGAINDACMHYCSEAPAGIDIVIDCGSTGNEGRFVNDDRGSAFESNATYLWTWDETTKEMFLFVVSEQAICKGEEILASYGPNFWESARTLQTSSHAKYWFATFSRIAQLERYLVESSVALPAVPVLVAGGPKHLDNALFDAVGADMYPRDLLGFDNVEPYACFAEAVLDVRGDGTDEAEYLVKFKGWDLSWNQWLEADLVDEGLIETFRSGPENAIKLAAKRWARELLAIAKAKHRVIKPKLMKLK